MFIDWNSVESLSSTQNLLDILGYIALGLLLLFEVGSHHVGSRKEELQNELNRKKDAQLHTLQSSLDIERSTLRSLTAVINISFVGKWDPADKPFSNSIILAQPSDTAFMNLMIHQGNEFRQIELFGTRMYRFIDQPGGWEMFAVNVALKPDDPLLGKPVATLRDIVSAVVFLPILAPNKLLEPTLSIPQVLIEFTLNGQKTFTKITTLGITVTPTQIPDHRFVAIGTQITGTDFVQLLPALGLDQ